MSKNFDVTIRFTKYEDYEQLPEHLRMLVDKASESAQNAYAPYSNFMVGAALMDANKKCYVGNNQENAAYPSGMCAERVALFAAFSQNPNIIIRALAVVAFGTSGVVPAPPCGSCRQTIMEYEVRQKKPIELVMGYDKGSYLVANGIEDLLPLSFTNEHLGYNLQ